MAKYTIDITTLTSIGDAIRAKDGTSAPIAVAALASRISGLSVGGESGIVIATDDGAGNVTLIVTAGGTITVNGEV